MQNRKLTSGECSIGSLIYFFMEKGGGGADLRLKLD